MKIALVLVCIATALVWALNGLFAQSPHNPSLAELSRKPAGVSELDFRLLEARIDAIEERVGTGLVDSPIMSCCAHYRYDSTSGKVIGWLLVSPDTVSQTPFFELRHRLEDSGGMIAGRAAVALVGPGAAYTSMLRDIEVQFATWETGKSDMRYKVFAVYADGHVTFKETSK